MQYINYEKSLEKVTDLVEKFKKEEVELKKFKEANIRMHYIDPLFEVLGWDVRDTENKHINKKDVIVEMALEVGNSAKSVDYSFRDGGKNAFFVEAKQVNIDLHTDKKPALQIRAYGILHSGLYCNAYHRREGERQDAERSGQNKSC